MPDTATVTRPRVTHISAVPFGENGVFGGGERYPLELARGMASMVPTRLVTFGTTNRLTTMGDLDVRTLATRTRVHGSALNPLSEKLITVIAASDIVHVHQWETVLSNAAVLMARALRKKIFVTDHGGSVRNYWRRLDLDRAVTGLLAVSDFAAGFYPEMAGVATTIYGGVDTDVFRADPSIRRGNHALFVGRLLPHKGIDVLIRGLDASTELRVVGRPYDAGFMQQLESLAVGKRVTFVRDADDQQVLHEYRTARAVVLPSVHEPVGAPAAPKSELLGLTLIEAMACGTPVICARTGGMPEVVDDGVSGLVVAPNDSRAVADAVVKLTTAGPVWDEWSSAARQRAVDMFTWRRVAERCLAAYRAALTATPAPAMSK